MKIDFIDSINDISAIDWQRLNTTSSPFLTYDFFKAIEVSGSASKAKGWQPHHMQISDNTNVEAILPLYIKHIRGESMSLIGPGLKPIKIMDCRIILS